MSADQESVISQEQAGWSYLVAPYFWMAGLDGSVAEFGAPPVDIDVAFTDILKSLDFSMMLVGQARYGRFSLSSDLLYLKVSTEKNIPRGIIANSVGLGAKTFEFTALAGYSVIDAPNGRLDVVGGARVWSVESTLSFSGGAVNGLWLRDRETWVDAMGGVKGTFNFSPTLYLTGWALAGGGSSELGWDVFAGLGYDFSERFAGVLGYRAASVDYQKGSFLFDVTMQGPVLGAVFRF
ncbi:hypothetical protein [Microbaculum marinum]|uniref:Outer membrane protein beta-barrel domain-containing protein n=1 Tax=Microbaculum marinum TaxID=1764581 RepID=A0AAW9RTQ7_9HYPH